MDVQYFLVIKTILRLKYFSNFRKHYTFYNFCES